MSPCDNFNQHLHTTECVQDPLKESNNQIYNLTNIQVKYIRLRKKETVGRTNPWIDNPVMKYLRLEHLISNIIPRIPCSCSWTKLVTKKMRSKDNSKKKSE